MGSRGQAFNFNSFKAALASGSSPEQAALQTFTGKMAARSGFTEARVVTATEDKVVVEFTRP